VSESPDDTTTTARTPASGERTNRGFALAVRGAVGFLTRFPVGATPAAWEAFRHQPAALVPVGYLVGALAAVPFLLGVPGPTGALLYPVVLVALVGINHADGLADLADAAVVHGESTDPVETRRRVLKDSALGVGGTVALAGLVAGLVLAGLALAGLPPLQAAGIVIAGEVSAKLGMATVACLGTAPFDGLGAQLARVSTADDLLGPVLVAAPAMLASWPSAAAGVALVAGVVAALATRRWASQNLGGVNGDVFGAANELGRLAALHAGVVTWTLV
jgi:adenosylcobinamide-GDP ribazoletransferase